MTVIFHTNAGLPVLAGDMLISTSEPTPQTDLKLPSHPAGIVVPSNPVPRHIPIKMRRKIFIINDHLAVGAAGDVISIRTFIDHLNDFFGCRPLFASQEVKDFLNGYAASPQGRDVFDQIHFVVLVEAQDWRGSLTRGWPLGADVFSERFGKVIAIGSGSDRVIEQIQKLDNYQYGLSQPPDGQHKFPEFQPLVQNLTLLGNVYWNEFVNPASVFQAWGGAYDLIYQGPDKAFRFLADYSLVLRMFDADQPEKGIQLMNVLKYERRQSVSYVAMPTDDGMAFFGAKDITASEIPVSITLEHGEFTMNSKYHISMIVVKKNNKLATPLVQVDGLSPDGDTKQTVFTWFDEKGRLAVAFHAEHDKWLAEQVKDYCSENAAAFDRI